MKVKTITCPNCGHANNFLAEECTQCGIHFSRYYEELEKAEALRRHIEEQEKAEARRREQEEKERLEAEARRKEEEEKAEARRREQEERERREAEAREREAEERRQAEEEAQAEARRREQEEQERREAESREQEARERRSQEEDQTRGIAAAAAGDTAEENRPPDETDEIEIEERDRDAIETTAGAFDYIEYPPEELVSGDQPENTDLSASPPNDYRPAASLQARLEFYEGRMIGLTYGNPAEIQNVKLMAVSSDHFQVFYPIPRHVVSFAYGAIVSITENAEGLSAVGPDISPVFPVVIELPRPFFHNH